MERVVLDTSVLIAHERGDIELGSLIRSSDLVAIAAVTAAELLVGAELGTPTRQEARRTNAERLIADLVCFDYDLAVARQHAELMAFGIKAGRPRGVHDLLIAATARANGCTVVTLDRRGFEGLPGVEVRAT